jgi:hypothetical protein
MRNPALPDVIDPCTHEGIVALVRELYECHLRRDAESVLSLMDEPRFEEARKESTMLQVGDINLYIPVFTQFLVQEYRFRRYAQRREE